MLRVNTLQLRLVEVGMNLDLVHRRNHRRLGKEALGHAVAEYGSLLLGWEDLSTRVIKSLRELAIGSGSLSQSPGS